MNTNKIIIVLTSVALTLSIIWTIIDKSFDSIITSITLVIALIGVLYYNTLNNKKSVSKMSQKSGKNSKNYQSNGDINIQN